MLDPDTASLDDLGRLQRQYRVASHEVGERDVRPDGIDDETLAWWIVRRLVVAESSHRPTMVTGSIRGPGQHILAGSSDVCSPDIGTSMGGPRVLCPPVPR